MNSSQDQMMLDYLLEMGALAPEQEDLMRKRATVEELRGMSQVPTETRNAGRVQRARHPLEMLAPVVGQGIAAYKGQGLDKIGAGLQQRKLEGIKKMRERMGLGAQAEGPELLGGPGWGE